VNKQPGSSIRGIRLLRHRRTCTCERSSLEAKKLFGIQPHHLDADRHLLPVLSMLEGDASSIALFPYHSLYGIGLRPVANWQVIGLLVDAVTR
jgi:hypothetical protein